MFEVKVIGEATGFRIELEHASIFLIKADKGLIACSYLSIKTAERLGDALCLVSGVSSFEDVLEAEIQEVSSKARKYGVREGMSGQEALKILS